MSNGTIKLWEINTDGPLTTSRESGLTHIAVKVLNVGQTRSDSTTNIPPSAFTDFIESINIEDILKGLNEGIYDQKYLNQYMERMEMLASELDRVIDVVGDEDSELADDSFIHAMVLMNELP